MAYVFANDSKTWITAKKGTGSGHLAGDPQEYTIKGVKITDGKLTIGLAIDKAKQTGWHTIQIKSLTANTASLIQGWGAKIMDLNKQQASLETGTAFVEARVAANAKAKADLTTAIGGLNTKVETFKTTYKIGDDASTLGNRGKADGSITNDVTDLETTLGKLKDNNTAFDPTAVTNANKTEVVGNTNTAWGGGYTGTQFSPKVTDAAGREQQMVENYNGSSCTVTGTIISQTLTGLANGLYDVVLFANAMHANGVDNSNAITGDRTDVAYVFANDKKTYITAKNANSTDKNGEYTIANVIVSDGTLTLGLGKDKAGTNWHNIQIKSLTFSDNDLLDTYNKEKTGYNVVYADLAAKLEELEAAAPGIKTAVENNAKTYKTANTAVADLKTYLGNKLKNDTNVNLIIKADGSFSGNAKQSVYTTNDFVLYRTGLDKDYPTVRNEVLADTTALRNAIEVAFANETLTSDWKDNDAITVTTKDAQNKETSKTYSIKAIKEAIDIIRSTAEAEQANWYGYRQIRSGGSNDIGTKQKVNDTFFNNSFTDARKDLDVKAGEGASAYYYGLVGDGASVTGSYETELEQIRLSMFNSLKARTAVADQAGFVTDLKALKAKIDAVQTNAAANLAKYNEQKKAGQETQTLWNNTYTEIAALNHSTQAQTYLDRLDAIQVTLTAAKEAVETNYTKGEAVAKAQDFAAIQVSINTVKTDEKDAYNTTIVADNATYHESFIKAIGLTTQAYQTAVQERANYSSTNDAIKAAVEAAAATLDAKLFTTPDDIKKLTDRESAAYVANSEANAALAEGERYQEFDVTEFLEDATTLEQDITNALNDFKAVVKDAIKNNVWQPKKNGYNSKLNDAKSAINNFGDAAKKNAFKDVEDLIAKGDAGVNAWLLAEVEAAIEALKDIDNMLAVDKDKAAEKDITSLFSSADKKYGDVKTYIEGVTIADDYNNVKATQLQNLENAYKAVTEKKELDKVFANHATVKSAVDAFTTVATNAENSVKTAVNNDKKNTEAYNDIVKAIAPVEAKLAEAKAAAAAYKYATSFVTVEGQLANLKEDVEFFKANGWAVAYKSDVITYLGTLSADIETTLTAAFGTEKTGLSADITELKNQYNAYVAANGLDDPKVAGFKADIDALEKALAEIAIADLDKPADGIQFDEILIATEALVNLQNDIADKQTELLAANASQANASVLADFQTQLGALETTASLEGFDEWVAEQNYDTTTLGEAIAALQKAIADLKAEIAAEENISFYKDQYQKKIDALNAQLTPVAEAIKYYDAKFKANAAAYEKLSAEIADLQAKIDAAKAKVGAYEYNGISYDFTYKIESYYWNEETQEYDILSGGAQYELNQAKAAIDAANETKSLTASSVVANKTRIESQVQCYLDNSAYRELLNQRNNLQTLLTNAIDVKYEANKYSDALWRRLVNEKKGINTEIIDLAKDIYKSNSYYEGSFDVETTWDENVNLLGNDYRYYYTLDENEQRIAKVITSDADYADQIAVVNEIKAKIADLSDAVDNLNLLGDANVDGKVNVLDYQKVLNMILDPTLQPEAESDLFINLDINRSEVIEVGDLTAVVNYILNKAWDDGWAAARAFGAENDKLTMSSSSQENGKRRFAVNLNGSDYTAFQMDMVLPNGMTLVGAELSSRAGESHKLYTRTQVDGSIRLVASSVKGETFSGAEGDVLYIDVEGAGNVELLNILFSDVNAQTRSFAIGGETTGIDLMTTFEALKQKVYDLGGRVKNGLMKGINIIRRADGTTEKVVK